MSWEIGSRTIGFFLLLNDQFRRRKGNRSFDIGFLAVVAGDVILLFVIEDLLYFLFDFFDARLTILDDFIPIEVNIDGLMTALDRFGFDLVPAPIPTDASEGQNQRR